MKACFAISEWIHYRTRIITLCSGIDVTLTGLSILLHVRFTCLLPAHFYMDCLRLVLLLGKIILLKLKEKYPDQNKLLSYAKDSGYSYHMHVTFQRKV